jgi:hypothetical protein
VSENSYFQIIASFLDSGGNANDRPLAQVPYDSARGQFNVGNLPDGSAKSLALPSPTIYQVYVKNLDASQSITVNWTPVGQAQVQAQVLAPGSMLLLWDVIGQGGGVTGVQLTASGAGNVNYEVFLGA